MTISCSKGNTDLAELNGCVSRITFRNPGNGHTVARLKLTGRDLQVTIVGNLLSVHAGEQITVRGRWRCHNKYGREFRVDNFQPVLPSTAESIEKYLGSGLIKGIGPVYARRIVAKFGCITLQVVESDIGRLRTVAGIGRVRLAIIRKAWQEHKDIRELMFFLRSCNVDYAMALRIYNHYGRKAFSVVTENPYRVAGEVRGITFALADRIALVLGTAKDDPGRIEAGILHVMNEMVDGGHVFCPSERLLAETVRLLSMDSKVVDGVMDAMVETGRLIKEQ